MDTNSEFFCFVGYSTISIKHIFEQQKGRKKVVSIQRTTFPTKHTHKPVNHNIIQETDVIISSEISEPDNYLINTKPFGIIL